MRVQPSIVQVLIEAVRDNRLQSPQTRENIAVALDDLLAFYQKHAEVRS